MKNRDGENKKDRPPFVRTSKKSVFDRIAPVYGLFYKFQMKHYHSVISGIADRLDLSGYKSVIDIGCGTGALCAVLHQKGLAVTGIEPAQKMLDVAIKNNVRQNIRFMKADVLERLPFDDKSFDISIASYVAHGLKAEERQAMYAEMNRVTRHLLIIYDYNKNRSLLTNAVEWLEGGDYFGFIKVSADELAMIFPQTQVYDVGARAAWYVCYPKD
ncbi:MAG: class I SAM-dependent methyltransferase [Saccharofermentanales bacterium]